MMVNISTKTKLQRIDRLLLIKVFLFCFFNVNSTMPYLVHNSVVNI